MVRHARRAVASIFLLLGVAGSSYAGDAGQRLLASGCSVSNVGYLTALAADYEKLTGVKMFVRGGGSVIGLEDLVSGSVDFAASCRGKIPEDPPDVEFIQVAWDALVFIVHPTTPVDTISFPQAQAIFQGTLRDWSRLDGTAGPIKVFLPRPTKGLSGVEDSIRSQVLHGGQPATGQDVSELASTGIVEQLIEKTPGSFGASGYSSARKRAVKILALNGVQPTKGTIVDRTYPLRRPLYLIVRRPIPPAVRAFVEFTLDKKGQGLISSYGAISLLEMR